MQTPVPHDLGPTVPLPVPLGTLPERPASGFESPTPTAPHSEWALNPAGPHPGQARPWCLGEACSCLELQGLDGPPFPSAQGWSPSSPKAACCQAHPPVPTPLSLQESSIPGSATHTTYTHTAHTYTYHAHTPVTHTHTQHAYEYTHAYHTQTHHTHIQHTHAHTHVLYTHHLCTPIHM